MPPKKSKTQGAKRNSITSAGKAKTGAAKAAEAARQEEIDVAKAAADAIPEEASTPGAPEPEDETKVKVEEEETPKKKKGTAKPKVYSKSATEKKTAPKKTGKRKQPVEDDTEELNGDTLVPEDCDNKNDATASPGKKQKTESKLDNNNTGTTKTTSRKQTAQSKATIEIDYDRINTHITQAINNAVTQTTHAMLLPCLELIQPFMNYALTCGGLNGGKETHAQDVGTTIHDAMK